MGMRTRRFDMALREQAADKAAWADAPRVIEAWNKRLALAAWWGSRRRSAPPWSPDIAGWKCSAPAAQPERDALKLGIIRGDERSQTISKFASPMEAIELFVLRAIC
jgi:hypothetical protein